MGEAMISKLFRKMVATQIISSMTVMLCMLIDSIMIGRYLGVDSMTAYGFSTPVVLVFAAISSMISAGIQVRCGKTMGAGDETGTNKCYSTSAAVTLLIAAVGVAGVLIFISPLCTLIGAGEDIPGNTVFGLTKDYLRGFIIGAPAFMFAQIMVPYMQMSGSRMRLVAAVIVMSISDIAFDFLNVFVLKWGTFGMGLASSLSYYIAVIIGLGYFVKKSCVFRFKFSFISMRTFSTIMKAGVPTLINQVSLVLLALTLNKLLNATAGHTAVAAYSAISTLGNICYSFSSGIASVALTLSSMLYIDSDKPSLQKLVKIMTFYSVVICGAVTAIVLIFASPMLAVFTEDPDVQVMASTGMRLFILSLIPCALNTSFKNYYQGVDHSRLTQIISILQNFALTALSAFVLSKLFGVTGIWFGFLCGEVLTLLVIAAVVMIRSRRFVFSAEAFSMLPEKFGAADEECREFMIAGESDIVPASKDAEQFCLNRGLSGRTSRLIALTTEELAYNIVRHGFSKDSYSHMIEIRIIVQDQKPTLRIRDNCIDFDPMKYLKLHKDDDPTAHIGLRMIMKMVKDANYVNLMGMNCLTLTL